MYPRQHHAAHSLRRGHARPDNPESCLAQRYHAFGHGRTLDIAFGSLPHDEVSNLLVYDEYLEDAGTALDAPTVANTAAPASAEVHLRGLFWRNAHRPEDVRSRLIPLGALSADAGDQALGDDTAQRLGDKERLQAKVSQARHRAHGTVGVQG